MLSRARRCVLTWWIEPGLVAWQRFNVPARERLPASAKTPELRFLVIPARLDLGAQHGTLHDGHPQILDGFIVATDDMPVPLSESAAFFDGACRAGKQVGHAS
nr:hypothetical protein BDOA9_0150870 [Bradyrhizobium sp. DOA9]